MLNIRALEDALLKIIKGVVGIQVIWESPNAPSPALPFITLKLHNLTAPGSDYESPPDSDGKAYLLGERVFSLDVNCYGRDSIDYLERLRTSLQEFGVHLQLMREKIAIVERGVILDLTELMDSKYISRAMMELKLRVSNQRAEQLSKFDVGFIDVVAGDGTFEGNVTPSPLESEFEVEHSEHE